MIKRIFFFNFSREIIAGDVSSLIGDVDGNCKVEVTDYLKVKKHVLGLSQLSGDSLKRADVNNDEKVSSLDYIRIKNIIVSSKNTKCTETNDENVAQKLNIYLLSSGTDDNAGSKNEPVKTLERAYRIQSEIIKTTRVSEVIVHVLSGVYKDQFLTWNNCSRDTIIRIVGEGDTIPTFTGNGSKNFFMTLNNSNNCQFIINHIKIQNYENGIRLNSKNNNYVGSNLIDDVHFYKIGDYYVGKEGYAAIDITYSSNNIIRNSTFDHVLNSEEFDNHIHAVYMAWGSSNNQIYNNSFSYVKPDPIRFRSASNNNKVYQNTFTKSGVFAYCSEWHSVVKNEGISKGNLFYNNILNSGYLGSQIDEIAIFKPDTAIKENTDTTRLKATNNKKN